MKNKILTGLLILVSFFGLGQGIELRPTFGFTWYETSELNMAILETSPLIGLTLNNSNRIYGETGCFWTNFKYDYDTSFLSNDSISYKLEMLRFPMKIGFSIVESKFFRWRIFLGVAAYLTLDKYNDVFWCVNGGTGMDIGPLFITCGYDFGVSNYECKTPMDFKTNINNFYVKVGYVFKIPNGNYEQDPTKLSGNYNPY